MKSDLISDLIKKKRGCDLLNTTSLVSLNDVRVLRHFVYIKSNFFLSHDV